MSQPTRKFVSTPQGIVFSTPWGDVQLYYVDGACVHVQHDRRTGSEGKGLTLRSDELTGFSCHLYRQPDGVWQIGGYEPTFYRLDRGNATSETAKKAFREKVIPVVSAWLEEETHAEYRRAAEAAHINNELLRLEEEERKLLEELARLRDRMHPLREREAAAGPLRPFNEYAGRFVDQEA
jgi:hypothetical protein